MSKEIAVAEELQQGMPESLSALVQLGTRTEAEQSMALRAIQLGVASAACENISRMHSMGKRALSVAEMLNETYLRKVEEELMTDTMTKQELRAEMNHIAGMAMEVTKLETKLIQGKPLFPEDTMSSEDRMILRMFNNITTPDQKQKFITLLEREFGSESFTEVAEEEPQSGGSYGDVEALAGQEVPAPPVVQDWGEGENDQAGPAIEEASVVEEVSAPIEHQAPIPSPLFAEVPKVADADEFEGM